MARMLLLAAALGLVGILAVPLLLSRRYSDTDRYKSELAEWHVRWEEAGSAEARSRLFAELERIQPPLASVSGASRHRQYVQAHRLVLLADEAADHMVSRLNAALESGPRATPVDCESLDQYPGDAAGISPESGVSIESVARACRVQVAARLHLADLRSEAVVDWLKDEIRGLRPGAVP